MGRGLQNCPVCHKPYNKLIVGRGGATGMSLYVHRWKKLTISGVVINTISKSCLIGGACEKLHEVHISNFRATGQQNA